MYIPSFDDVKVAHERIRPHIHRTPVLTSTFINAMTGADLFFKCENPEGRRLQGSRRLERGLRARRGDGEEGRGHPFLGQPRALASPTRRATFPAMW